MTGFWSQRDLGLNCGLTSFWNLFNFRLPGKEFGDDFPVFFESVINCEDERK